MKYSDIPRRERRQLAAQVRAENPLIRKKAGFAAGMGVVCGGGLASSIVSRHESPWLHVVVTFILALTITWLIWRWTGEALLRSEVEKRKSA